MAQEFKSSDDSSISSASPSPSARVSFENFDFNPSPSPSLSLNDQVKKIVDSYLIKQNMNPSDIKKLLDDYTKELSKENTENIKDIEKKISNAEDEIQNSKQRVTETLSIFVALFTFVSVSFQIFDKVGSFVEIVSLELILIGSLILFILLLHLLMQPRKKRNDYGEAFLKSSITSQIKIASRALLWDKPLMLLLNNGTVAVLLLFSILLIVGGVFGVYYKTENIQQSKNNNLPIKQVENNINFIKEASKSADF